MSIALKDYFDQSWTHKKKIEEKLKLTILAAGLGKRMDPLTAHHLPKPMFPIGGNFPMLEVWVRRAIESGIQDISMNLCVLSDTIRDYFKDGSKFGGKITYVDEDIPSGTLGGICKQALGNKAKQVFPNELMPKAEPFKGTTIIAPSGDIVTNFSSNLLEQMYDIHKKKGATITMVLTPIDWNKRAEFGTVELGNIETKEGLISKVGNVLSFREKDPNSPSNLNNASIYMIEMELLEELDSYRTKADSSVDKPFYDFGKHVFPAMLGNLDYIKLSKKYKLCGIQYDGLWYDIGRKRDYLDVNKAFLNGVFDFDTSYEKYPWGYIGTNVTIDFSKVNIIPPAVIGDNCIIAPGSTIGPYAIIGDNWTIERNSKICNSVLWKYYSYFPDDGEMISEKERRLEDRHQVRSGINIDNCIIVGGTIMEDLKDVTVDVLENGEIKILPIDWIPPDPRA